MVYEEQWEYKKLGDRFGVTMEELNLLGFEGWELVCVVYDSDADAKTAYLKRKKA